MFILYEVGLTLYDVCCMVNNVRFMIYDAGVNCVIYDAKCTMYDVRAQGEICGMMCGVQCVTPSV